MEDDCEWAWLPKDLLHSILDQLLPMEDVIRFSAVCTEWRSVAVENFESRSLHRRQVPFLMSRTKDDIGNLHSVTQKKMYKFRFPMPDNMKCCGSSLGWLIMVDVTMDVILFNPFSGNAITLPPIRRLVFEKRYALEVEDILRLSALQRYEYEIRLREEYGEEELGMSLDDMTFDLEDDDEIQGEEETDEKEEKEEEREREIGSVCRIRKGVLSADPSVCPDDYVLMVIYGVEERLAFIKSGDEDWTYIDNKTSGFDYLFKKSPPVKGFRYFEDILYWKSQFYAVDGLGKLLSCEINTNFTNLRVKIVDVPMAGFGIDATSSSTFFQQVVESLRNISIIWSAFLVESVEGDLLWVPKFRFEFLTMKFYVYQLVDNGGNVGWVKKEDLGDAALFLGDNHSISVRASDFPGCQPNSIYFVDKENETNYPGHSGGDHFDMGVYNLEHKAVARDYQLNPSQMLNPSSIWILPTFM
ncbi:hypothetical protein PVL29_021206 [Vitis rotundifolia]|uniref:F-box domain-containing protein n=1 Tax=Vitis rotundifolia TaxID=103349 RepID=A0AA38YZC7_VITRO|nr:hypothetical protein PVL29_021206 [Vitis rotundifolia]